MIGKERTDGADIYSHVRKYAALLDYNNAARKVYRNPVFPESVRVCFHDYRNRFVNQTDVRLLEHCLLSTRR